MSYSLNIVKNDEGKLELTNVSGEQYAPDVITISGHDVKAGENNYASINVNAVRVSAAVSAKIDRSGEAFDE